MTNSQWMTVTGKSGKLANGHPLIPPGRPELAFPVLSILQISVMSGTIAEAITRAASEGKLLIVDFFAT